MGLCMRIPDLTGWWKVCFLVDVNTVREPKWCVILHVSGSPI